MRIPAERTFRCTDGTELFYRHWPATAAGPKRAVVMFHRGHEHSGRMQHVVDELDLPVEELEPWPRAYQGAPTLDLVVPTVDEVDRAVAAIDAVADARPTLVSCALGYSRSALVVAAWMLAMGRAPDPERAGAAVARARPRLVLSAQHRARLAEWFATRARATPVS